MHTDRCGLCIYVRLPSETNLINLHCVRKCQAVSAALSTLLGYADTAGVPDMFLIIGF